MRAEEGCAEVPSTQARWQATQWFSRASRRSGSSSAHRSTAIGQRVLNRQPLGGLIGLGTSPSRMMRFRVLACAGLGIGTLDSSACV